MRWISPEGMLCPNEFVPLFERDGVIAELDFYMFCQVCALLKRWEREGRPLFCVSVNVSRSNFDVSDFFARYERHIAENQVPARYLEFEFTESVVFDRTGRDQPSYSAHPRVRRTLLHGRFREQLLQPQHVA